MIRLNLLLVLLSVAASSASAQTTRPSATTRPTAPRAGPGASGVEVAIVSVKTEHVVLRRPLGDGKFDEQASGGPLFVVRLRISNNGPKDVTYQTFNGTPSGRGDDRASLADTARKFTPLVGFGDYQVAGAATTAVLKPGDAVEDVLAFAPFAEGVKPALLYLPAKNHGDTSMWKLSVPEEK
jgi:hypothetical protein